MANVKDLINALKDGKANARHASELETDLKMGVGRTQEPTRDLIREAVIKNKYPIGSIPRTGYFLIDNEQEYQETIDDLKARIKGLKRRIEAITCGWKKRQASRSKNRNWPK